MKPLLVIRFFEMTQQEIANRKRTKLMVHQSISCLDVSSVVVVVKLYQESLAFYKQIQALYLAMWKKYHGESLCTTPHLTEDEIKEAFVKMLNQLVKADDTVLKLTRYAIDEVFDTTKDREQAVICRYGR